MTPPVNSSNTDETEAKEIRRRTGLVLIVPVAADAAGGMDARGRTQALRVMAIVWCSCGSGGRREIMRPIRVELEEKPRIRGRDMGIENWSSSSLCPGRFRVAQAAGGAGRA